MALSKRGDEGKGKILISTRNAFFFKTNVQGLTSILLSFSTAI